MRQLNAAQFENEMHLIKTSSQISTEKKEHKNNIRIKQKPRMLLKTQMQPHINFNVDSHMYI